MTDTPAPKPHPLGALNDLMAAVISPWRCRAEDAQAAMDRCTEAMDRFTDAVADAVFESGTARRVISFDVLEEADPDTAPGRYRVEWEAGRHAGEFYTDDIQQAMDAARRYALDAAGAMED